MKFHIALLCGFALLISVSGAGAAGSREIAGWHEAHGGHKYATPVWTLPKATAPENMVWGVPSMPGDVKASRFYTAEDCGGCHDEIFKQWKGSMMGNAWKDPVFIAVYKHYLAHSNTAQEKEETAICSRCHTPVGYIADAQGRYFQGELSEAERDGVYCDVCHSMAKSAGVGNGAFILEPGDAAAGVGGVKYGPRKDAESPFHDTAYSDLHTRSELCGVCHDVAHAHNIMPIENTYTEWRTGPYNTGDPKTSTHCQDCHMRQTPTVAGTGVTALPDSPGFSAPREMGGKARDHVWQHWFIGGNAAVPELLGNPEWARMAKDRLSKAVVVSIENLQPAKAGEIIRFNVRVENVGAGHYLPTGLTYVRQMWLHVQVKDSKQNVVYESGGLDKAGNIDASAVIYKTVLGEGGTERKPTFFLPVAVQVLSDKRIRPKGYSIEPYAFELPNNLKGDAEIEVTVRYRSAPQFLINDLLGKDAPELPIFNMASAKQAIKVR